MERPTLQPMIQGIVPGLPEIGKIKIGRKGKLTTSRGGKMFQLPERIDHFIVTTLERGDDGNFLKNEMVHQGIGQKPTVIPVSLLYNDPELNFQSRRACFVGSSLWCAGDGVNAYRKQKDGSQKVRECPCERAAPDFNADQHRCKVTGVLSVVLGEMLTVGGVFKFRTTSYNSVVNIMSSLALIQRITGGVLAGIPLILTLRPKTVIVPGSQKTMKVFVVGIEYQGSMRQLADVGYQIALGQAKHQQRIEHIETQARVMITGVDQEADIMLQEDETEQDIAEEFYPESIDAKLDEDSEPELSETSVVDEPMRTEPAYNTPPAPEPEGNDFYSLFPSCREIDLDKYVKACAKHFECSDDEIQQNARENPDAFSSAFRTWIAKQQVPEQTEKRQEPEPENPDQAFIDEWKNKRAGGFSTYVYKNIKRFAACSPEARLEAIAKWNRLYPDDDWPVAANGATQPMVKTEIVQPGPPDGTDDFDSLINSDQWQEMSALKAAAPDQYFLIQNRVTAGRAPRTMSEVIRIIDQMSIADSEGMPVQSMGAADGMPGA